MRSCPEPGRDYRVAVGEHLLYIKALIGKWRARQADPLLEASHVKLLPIPRITRIVVDGVPVRQVPITLVDVAFRPDRPDELGEKQFSIHVLDRRASYTPRGVL